VRYARRSCVSEGPAARQQPAGARSETSANPGSGMLPAQAPAGSTSQSREPARAAGVVPPDARIATPAAAPPPAPAPTAPQQNNALRPNPEQPQIVTLERSGVNIRSAPSANSRVVGRAPKGTRFEVKQRKGRWVEIESNEVRGWVSPSFWDRINQLSEGRRAGEIRTECGAAVRAGDCLSR
jgi:hypothetical protein